LLLGATGVSEKGVECGTAHGSGARWPAAVRKRLCRCALIGSSDACGPVPALTAMINVRTARTLGVSIPPDLAAQVTEWIQ